ncbi:MAG: flagellar export chaperone FliS [Bryobacterales bacterium]|jgi:flagellar secretion chaperone FliS|nr:flagellar export chaperone FliS [Bryobacterales bacterium]
MEFYNAYTNYQELQVMGATPVELIRMLYREAVGSVRMGRRFLAAGDVAGRARSLGKAQSIVIELAASLNHAAGGNLAVQLLQIYDYLLTRLAEGQSSQRDQPLEEAERILTTLADAWEQCPDEAELAASPAA